MKTFINNMKGKTIPLKLSSHTSLNIHAIPIFQDNYCYSIINNETNEYLLIDPADPNTIEEYTSNNQLFNQKKLISIFVTHKHWDHSGGNEFYFNKNIPIYGSEECNHITHKISNDIIPIFSNQQIKIHSYLVPCHTKGHLLFTIYGDNDNAIFSGDSIFIGGCGRFFEGNANDLQNIIKLINFEICKGDENIMKNTKLFCGHEYTLANLEFVMNKLDSKYKDVYLKYKELVDQGIPSVPSTIYDENEFNPYFRIIYRNEHFNFDTKDTLELLQKVREMKNNY